VTLTSEALTGGFIVNLSSNNTAVIVPATVKVAKNATSAKFTATVSSVATAQAVTLMASAGNVSETFALQLNASYFVQAVASTASGSANSLSLSFPANTLAGDLVLFVFDFGASTTPSSVTDSQGNIFTPVGTQLASPGGSQNVVYYAKNIKGGADTVTVTIAAKANNLELYLTEYTGIDQTNPIDAQAGASGSSGPVSSGNATTNFAGDVVYGYCPGDGVCTAGPGFSTRSSFDSNLIEDETAGNSGSYAATGSASSGWTMKMVALKPASSRSGPSTPAITWGAPAGINYGTALSATQLDASSTIAGSFAYTPAAGTVPFPWIRKATRLPTG